MTCYKEPLFRLRRAVVTHERHTSALRVSVGDPGRQVLRSYRSTLLGRRHQCSGERRHQRRADVVQSEREVTLSAQSQVSATVSTVPRRTRQLWTTATCPWHHRRPTRFVDNSHWLQVSGWPHAHAKNMLKCVSWLGNCVYSVVSPRLLLTVSACRFCRS